MLTSALRSGGLTTTSVAEATPSRSPGVSSTAFRAQPPNLRFAPLMDMDFAVSCPLVRRWRLISGFCPSTRTFVPCFLQTPPRGGSPCIITRPYLHQVDQSSRAKALDGLRMMPLFPLPPLKCRTVGFPQYGFKAGMSVGAFPSLRSLKPAPGIHDRFVGLHPPFAWPRSDIRSPVLSREDDP